MSRPAMATPSGRNVWRIRIVPALREPGFNSIIDLMEAVLPLEQMSVEEKLRALEKIWEALAKDEAQLPVPDWHKKVLDQRQREIDSGEAKSIPLDQFKERVRKQTG